jgi:hypothetical protein
MRLNLNGVEYDFVPIRLFCAEVERITAATDAAPTTRKRLLDPPTDATDAQL